MLAQRNSCAQCTTALRLHSCRTLSRIVCLTEETTETLYLLGEGDRVVGVSGYTVRPPEARQKPRISSVP